VGGPLNESYEYRYGPGAAGCIVDARFGEADEESLSCMEMLSLFLAVGDGPDGRAMDLDDEDDDKLVLSETPDTPFSTAEEGEGDVGGGKDWLLGLDKGAKGGNIW